jgi:hypothetical protein
VLLWPRVRILPPLAVYLLLAGYPSRPLVDMIGDTTIDRDKVAVPYDNDFHNPDFSMFKFFAKWESEM